MRAANYVIILIMMLVCVFSYAQPQPPVVYGKQDKVGVVLSGGGASGMAHIGVLKALEENQIPIDYICGTSSGALIGAMYAMGYSPWEIEQLVKTEDFKSWATGVIQPQYVYYFKKKEDNASWLSFKMSLDTSLVTSLPTNFISPIPMDFALMERTAAASAAANYKFDSLFIPFRCVASDVASKESVIFRNGDLGQAIRASMSYPIYLKPITVNGRLLFDGGLYNNFPSNIMYTDFFPDFIIGSNVATAFANPEEDNLISQIRAMLTSKTDFTPQCENGIIIEPNADWVGLFDFENAQAVIDSGYAATIRQIEEIKLHVTRRVAPDDLKTRRENFHKKLPPLVFGNLIIEGDKLTRAQVNYTTSILRKKKKSVALNELKPQYFRLAADDKLKSIYPLARYNKSTGLYDLTLSIKKERPFTTQFGGNFSNRPINMGFIAMQYDLLSNPSVSVMGNAYFGKLYSSVQLKTRIDFSTQLPFYVEPSFTWNRFDYFRSSPAFFEDTKPAYLIMWDRCGEINLGLPVNNKTKLSLATSYAFIRDLYYQVDAFQSADTADRTDFTTYTSHLLYERSTLNRKQYASQGTYFAFKARFVQGEEYYQPGSTAIIQDRFRAVHNWFVMRIVYDTYFKERGSWRLGFYGEAVYSSQPFFSNYFATMLSAPAFMPTPESKTYFIPEFRAHQFAGAGLKNIFVLNNSIDFRLEGFVMLPYQAIQKEFDNTAAYSAPLSISDLEFIAMSALVWHSPLGPVSLSANYYSSRTDQVSMLFHFGYIIFNRKALD